jgi:RNA polymerase sigma factor (sigma-70 family)
MSEATPPGTLRQVAFAVAYRMLGDGIDAEDVAQDAMVRWLGTDAAGVERPIAFVATIAARLALNLMRNRRDRSRRLAHYGLPIPLFVDAASATEATIDVHYGVVVLSMALPPLARAVFILRHAFDLSFEDIGSALERSPAACRQSHSRARRMLADLPDPVREPARPDLLHGIVAAITAGNINALAKLLSHDVALLSDGGARGPDIGRIVAGRDRIARLLVASPAIIGSPLSARVVASAAGPVLLLDAAGKVVFSVLAVGSGAEVAALYVLSDPVKLERLSLSGP